eukprot:scaffold672635_cov134-Prasinocladus_malaysianus.AAC.1
MVTSFTSNSNVILAPIGKISALQNARKHSARKSSSSIGQHHRSDVLGSTPAGNNMQRAKFSVSVSLEQGCGNDDK